MIPGNELRHQNDGRLGDDLLQVIHHVVGLLRHHLVRHAHHALGHALHPQLVQSHGQRQDLSPGPRVAVGLKHHPRHRRDLDHDL